MKINYRYIIFGIIIIICVISLALGIYLEVSKNKIELPNTSNATEEVDLKELASEFNNIFTNSLNYQNYNIDNIGVIKLDASKDLIFSRYSKKETIEKRYDININIPYVNISNSYVQKFNEQLEQIYMNKANDIINNANNSAIYTVEYQGYINTNILSLVIKSTLKEGNNPQRVMVQTYNYNLSTNEELSFTQALEIKELNKQEVANRVFTEITEVNREAQALKELGYNVYIRDLNNIIYNMSDNTSFFIGENGRFYVLYPYGNSNYTSELDIIVFK